MAPSREPSGKSQTNSQGGCGHHCRPLNLLRPRRSLALPTLCNSDCGLWRTFRLRGVRTLDPSASTGFRVDVVSPTGVLLGRKDGTSRRIPLESLRADIYLREFIHAPGEPSDSERVSHRYPVSFGALFDLKEGRPATLTKEARDGLMTWLPQAGFILKKTSRHKIRGRTVMVMQVYRRPRARRKPT